MKVKKKVICVILLIIIIAVSFTFIISSNNDSKIVKILKNKVYETYKSGDIVNFNDEKWYVMYDSDKNDDYITLISKDILYLEDSNLSLAIDGIYETSSINEYLKNDYTKSLGEEKLVEKNGYSVRLFNEDDFKNLVDATYNEKNDEYIINNCPEFICLTNTFYATMIDTNSNKEFIDVYNNVADIENLLYEDYVLHLKYYNLTSTYNTYKLNSLVDDATLFVRPVINVYKNNVSK